MATGLRFVLTGTGQQLVACGERLLDRGHTILAVLSECPEVGAWTSRRNLTRLPMAVAGQATGLTEPFDYLLSIVNHAILPPALLNAPARGAINYHDSLLPSLGGFNATAWAILEEQRTHGITWHRMTAAVDEGTILLQHRFDVHDDDTAFTLGVRCSEAGVETFATLLQQMERDAFEERPQSGARSFHFRSERSGTATLDFTRPAATLHALVRALNHGPEDNWMAKPKLVLGATLFAVMETRLQTASSGRAPGTVTSVSGEGLEIACGTGSIQLVELSTLDGRAVNPLQVAVEHGLIVGQTLPPVDSRVIAVADQLDASVTKSERFWVQRLSTLRAPVLPGLDPHAHTKTARVLERTSPAALSAMPDTERSAVLVASLAAFLSRVGGDDTGGSFDLAFRATVPDDVHAFYAPVTPFRCTVDKTAPVRLLVEQVRTELTNQAKRHTYALDVLQRYQALRDRPHVRTPLPIGVCVDADETSPASMLRGGQHLVLVPRTSGGYGWVFDEAAMSADTAVAFAERFDELLEGVLAAPGTAVQALPILRRADRELLLSTWQQTTRPYDTVHPIHQQIELQAKRTPNDTAVVFDNTTLTYGELDRRANHLAHALRARGVGPDVLVGICVERSLELVIGLLGILKAGGAYVPLDPAYPSDRLAIMLEDSKAQLVVTETALASELPPTSAALVFVDQMADNGSDPGPVSSGVTPAHLAYVIFTSGSTGRPKGTMVEHRNVSNFFAGMDEAIADRRPGVWLAVTSISFDISVLELFWTLARGYKVVVAPESDRASIERRERAGAASRPAMGFGLFYFAADSSAAPADPAGGGPYRLLLEGAKFADEHGFEAVWTPERHFHAFGGLYPNPAVTTAALATITKRVHLRAGSVVLPLHNPLRVAEDWAVIDQLSGGRVGFSIASGWHVNDFAFMPQNYERRRDVMLESLETVLKLWAGEKVSVSNGAGQTIEVAVLPRPVQTRPPIWIASAGNVDTFILAGQLGANILTNMLGQDLQDLAGKFDAYRQARRAAGHAGDGTISVMLHTFVCGSDEEARRLARKPFSDYLASSFDLVKVAPKMFPAFRQPSRAGHDAGLDTAAFTPEDMAALMEHAFDRYFDTAGLFGTPERALEMVDKLAGIGATEMACLIDFGIDTSTVLASLPHLGRLRELAQARRAVPRRSAEPAAGGIADLIERHGVTHLQCTPSMARMLASDPTSLRALGRLDRLLLGGEALPADLAEQMATAVAGRVMNMYGPTETTVWSTTADVARAAAPTIGRPIANTTIRIVDEGGELTPVGIAGELCIGGDGVTRGYLDRPELTRERFVPDKWSSGRLMYRTGDLARYLPDGNIEFLGRLDHQVKLNGYRIELGEIETVLVRHPAVRQAVVTARTRSDGGAPALVGYLVLSGSTAGDDNGRVQDWQRIWDTAYRAGHSDSDPRFRISGWNDSYSGEAIPAEQMREWLDATIDRIRSLDARRVLEIGCGTGMILFGMVPHVERYTGTDIAPAALESIRAELTAAETAKVTLLAQPAHTLEGLAERSFDAVVINSVAQYFPDADYLVRVLRRAVELVADGGQIFVGDVRSLAHLEAFHTSIELAQAAPHTSDREVQARVARRTQHESELVLSEAFFHALVRDEPRLAGVDVELKRGRSRNELTRFRYDVVLHVGPKGNEAAPGAMPAAAPVNTLSEVRDQLAAQPDALYLSDVPNARLAGLLAAHDAAASASPSVTADAWRTLADAEVGIDPEALYTLDSRYAVRLRWASSGNPGRFDAVLRRVDATASSAWPFSAPTHTATATTYANTPIRKSDESTLTTQLADHLRQSVPEYMVPSAFVVLDAFPLTPNGKIDRKALPEPKGKVDRSTGSTPGAVYAPPASELEAHIVKVWEELLAVDRVSRQDNIFDLGANSLLTMQANNRLSSILGRKVSLVDMFRYPTVESLGAHLSRQNEPGASQDTDKRAKERASRAEQAAERRRALRAEKTGR